MTGTCEAPESVRVEARPSSDTVVSGGKFFVLLDRIGSLVKCSKGQVWITQENDSRDIILRAGQTFKLDRAGKTIFQGMPCAHLHIS